MNLVRDILDQQILDRRRMRMGRVDGVVIELRDGAPPRVLGIELGSAVLARRISRRLGKWVEARWRRAGIASAVYRIPWSAVKKVSDDIEVDLDFEKTPAFRTENWLRENVVSKLPGGK